MSKFIEVDIVNTDSKTLVNVDQIVNVGEYKLGETGYISFNSSGGHYENCIQTKQSYEELKSLILNVEWMEKKLNENLRSSFRE